MADLSESLLEAAGWWDNEINRPLNFRLTVPSGSSSAGYSSFERITVRCVPILKNQPRQGCYYATNFTRSRKSQRKFSDHLALWGTRTHTDKDPSSNNTGWWISHVRIGIHKLWVLNWLISETVWNKLRADLPVCQILKKNPHRLPPG